MNAERIQELREQARAEIVKRLIEGLSLEIPGKSESEYRAFAEKQPGLQIAIDVWVTMEIRRLALERFYRGFTYHGLIDLPIVDTRPSATV